MPKPFIKTNRLEICEYIINKLNHHFTMVSVSDPPDYCWIEYNAIDGSRWIIKIFPGNEEALISDKILSKDIEDALDWQRNS